MTRNLRLNNNLSQFLKSGIVAFFLLTCFSLYSQDYNVRSEGVLLGISKKGDLKASASLINPMIFSRFGYHVQAGYSPLRGLSLALGHGWQRDRIDPFNKSNNIVVDGAIGTYVVLKVPDQNIDGKPKKGNANILLDFYMGYGKGFARATFANFVDGYADFKNDRYFVQGGIHLLGNKFKISYTFKRVKQFTYSGYVNGKPSESVAQFVNRLRADNSLVFIEQAVQTRFGSGPIEYTLGIIYNQASYHAITLNVGVNMDINRLMNKGKKTKKKSKK